MIQTVVTILVGLIAAWRLVALLRAPVATRGRIFVFLLFTSSFVSNLAEFPAVHRLLDTVASGLAGLVSSLSLLGFFVGFLVFFGGASRDRRFWTARVQLRIVGAVAVCLVVAWAVSIPTGNSMQFLALPADAGASLWSYALIGNLYLGYACVACAFLAGTEAARGSRSGRVAFSLCALGMTLCFVGGPLFRVPATAAVAVGAAAGGGGSSLLRTSQGSTIDTVLGIGIVLVALGLVFVALGTVAGKAGLSLRAKRHGWLLFPLRRDLTAAFPPIALAGAGGRIAELVRPTGSLYRYRRAVVECRDGLWQLSPWLESPETAASATPDAQARLVHEALDRHGRGDDPISGPTAIAAPGADTAEDAALLTLARAYAGLDTPVRTPAAR